MTTEEVGKGLVERCRKGDLKGAVDAYYSPDIVSTEPQGDNPVSRGLDAIHAKTQWFESTFTVHGLKVSEAFVHGDQFAVEFDLDVTEKASGKRSRMH